VLGVEHPETVRGVTNLGLVNLNLGRHEQAESLLRAALTSYEKIAPDGWERYNCQSLLGASVAGQKRYQEAEPLAVDAYEALIQRKSSISPANASVMDQAGRRVIQLYRDWGKPEKAAEWAKRMGIRSSARAGQRVLPHVERECHTRPPTVAVRAADCHVAHRNKVHQARFPPKAIT
jgi:tetratricopeptide (TPR) repeat protein